jgi:hypothetical protein
MDNHLVMFVLLYQCAYHFAYNRRIGCYIRRRCIGESGKHDHCDNDKEESASRLGDTYVYHLGILVRGILLSVFAFQDSFPIDIVSVKVHIKPA